MNKTIIVEFNGLPGSGKTTISKLLKKKLEDSGHSVITQYFRYYWQRYTIPFLIIPYCPKLYKKVRAYSETILPVQKRTHMHSFVYFLRMYNQIKKYSKADFALIDQAFIQDSVSLGWLDPMPHSEKYEAIVNELKIRNVEFIRVDCVNNINLSMERIKKRPQIGHFFESINNSQLEEILKIQSNNFDYIRDVFSSVFDNQTIIEIDTQLSPEINAEIIKEKIIRLKRKI